MINFMIYFWEKIYLFVCQSFVYSYEKVSFFHEKPSPRFDNFFTFLIWILYLILVKNNKLLFSTFALPILPLNH